MSEHFFVSRFQTSGSNLHSLKHQLQLKRYQMTTSFDEIRQITSSWISWFKKHPTFALGISLNRVNALLLDLEKIRHSTSIVSDQFSVSQTSIQQVDTYNLLTRKIEEASLFVEKVKLSRQGSLSNSEKTLDLLEEINDLVSDLLKKDNITLIASLEKSSRTQDQIDLHANTRIIDDLSSGIIKETQRLATIGSEDSLQEAQFERSRHSDSADILIVTALQKEREAVLKTLRNVGVSYEEIWVGSRQCHSFTVASNRAGLSHKVVLLCTHDMGNIRSALATQSAILTLHPTFVILTGISGGIKKDNEKRSLGDVIIADQILYYESTKQTPSGDQLRHMTIPANDNLRRAAKTLSSRDWTIHIETERPDGQNGRINPTVHYGIVASGETLVADKEWQVNIQTYWSQLVGVEMEGAGVALAAIECGLNGILLIKGISDWADDSKNDDWQKYASESAASFVIALVKSGLLSVNSRY